MAVFCSKFYRFICLYVNTCLRVFSDLTCFDAILLQGERQVEYFTQAFQTCLHSTYAAPFAFNWHAVLKLVHFNKSHQAIHFHCKKE